MGQAAMAETSAQGTGTQAGRGCSGRSARVAGDRVGRGLRTGLGKARKLRS